MDDYAAREIAMGEKVSEEISATLKEKLQNKLFGKKQAISVGKFPAINLHWRVAAVFVPLIICLGIFYFPNSASQEMVVKTSFGEVRTITLPDNSTVILNANSTLRYSEDWSLDQPREVMLYGEGYFNVVHQHNHEKFLVHTSNEVTIEVLGTQFNVNNRRDRTQVVLESGKIKLGMENRSLNEILMRSGDYAEVSSQGKIIRKAVDARQYTSWQNRNLIFNETPLKEILSILEDNYGYKATVRDSALLKETFTATYPADDVNVLLTALSKSFKITINRSGKEILVGI